MLEEKEEVTLTDSVVTIPDGEDSTIQSLKVGLEPIQEGSGDPSPTNIRPITGRSEVTIMRTGKNLLKPNKYQASANVLTLGQDDNTSYRTFLKAGTYTISYKTVSTNKSIYYQTPNSTGVRIASGTSGSFTLTKDSYCRFWLYLSSGVLESDISETMIELGSTASSYEPYQGNTYTISLGQTVYGGTVDVTEGKLTINMAKVTIQKTDLSTVTVDGNNVRCTLNGQQISSFKNYSSGFCNKGLFLTSWAGVSSNSLGVAINNPANKQFIVNKAIGQTLDEIREFIGDDGLEICTELATPIEIDLTTAEITLLNGTNNIWSDSGNVTMQYLFNKVKDFLETYLLMKGVNL